MGNDRFAEWKAPLIEDGRLTQWNWMVQHKDGLVLGEKSDIGAFTYINAKHGVEIGAEAQIGSHCSIYSESTIDGKAGKVVIEEGACIGSHSVVMPGITIGAGSIVGAFSFVNRDVPPGVIALGVPVKVTRKKDERSE